MCGICGRIDPRGVNPAELERMTAVLSHRGPDGQGIYVDDGVGFGHRRLAIIDLAGGRQPMSNEDDTVWITFNGEIYNFQELKKGLEANHRFKTNSDTEIILHLYEEKGTGCLQHLRGMFSFALYDHKEQKLLLARDHLGQKPLYYYHNGTTLAFASEIKALLALDPGLRELDREALYEYLTIRIITPPRSMFKRIRKLPPGHFLVFHNGKVSIDRYWHLRYEPKLPGDFATVLEGLEQQVLSTVQYHLVSDVPVGAFLSGGIDSSLVVAMMSKAASQPIRTFSGDVPYKHYSEISYARMVAGQYQTEHGELAISPSLLKTLPDLIWHLDEPSDLLAVCVYYLSEFARRHVKVVLGGDGGDELFGGYDRYYGNVLVSRYALLPGTLRKHIFGRMVNVVPDGFWYRSLSHRLKWINQMSFFTESERYAKSLGYFYFSDAFRQRFYTDDFRRSVGMFDPEACIKDSFDSANATDVIDKMLFSDSMVRMPDHPNMVLDRMTMAHGLEARSPFLDHKLAEFSAAIPSHYKVRGTTRRYIQLELARHYLPQALIKKRKQGFASALIYLLADEFRLLYELFLYDSHLASAGYIQQAVINELLDEHLARKVDHGSRLWLICNAEVWYRMYMENATRADLKQVLNGLRDCCA